MPQLEQQQQQQQEEKRKRRVLFLSLEFVDPIFSGNGVLSRGTVEGLRKFANCSVMILCGRPAGEIIHQTSPTAAVASQKPTSNTQGATNTSNPATQNVQDQNNKQQLSNPEPDLIVHCVTVSKWYKLDRDSAWEEYGNGVAEFASAVRDFKPDVVLGVDWTSRRPFEVLSSARGQRVCEGVPFVFLNFRVFCMSNGISEEEKRFYRLHETATLRLANAGTALCGNDRGMLQAMARLDADDNTNNKNNKNSGNDSDLHSSSGSVNVSIHHQHRPEVTVIHPPLRADIHALAMQHHHRTSNSNHTQSKHESHFAGSTSALPHISREIEAINNETHQQNDQRVSERAPTVASAQTIPAYNTEPRRTMLEHNDISHDSSSERSLLAINAWLSTVDSNHQPNNNPAQQPQRKYITCCCRVCPEKQVMVFVEMLEILAPELRQRGLVPFLVGPPTDAAYARTVHQRLRAAFPGDSCVIIPTFVDSVQLSAIFARSVLNVHPPTYEAYGMVIAEAAAFGAPTLMDGQGGVGCAELLSAPNYSFFTDMNQPKVAAYTLRSILRPAGQAILDVVREMARSTSVRWNDAAAADAMSLVIDAAVSDFQLHGPPRSSVVTTAPSLSRAPSSRYVHEINSHGHYLEAKHSSSRSQSFDVTVLEIERNLFSLLFPSNAETSSPASTATMATGARAAMSLLERPHYVLAATVLKPWQTLDAFVRAEVPRHQRPRARALELLLLKDGVRSPSGRNSESMAMAEDVDRVAQGLVTLGGTVSTSVMSLRFKLVPSHLPEDAFWILLVRQLRQTVESALGESQHLWSLLNSTTTTTTTNDSRLDNANENSVSKSSDGNESNTDEKETDEEEGGDDNMKKDALLPGPPPLPPRGSDHDQLLRAAIAEGSVLGSPDM